MTKVMLTERCHLAKPQHGSALVDSGATSHMFGDIRFFVPGTLRTTNRKIVCADGQCLYAFWVGVVKLVRNASKSPVGNNLLVLRNSLLVEGIETNLISVSALAGDGHKVSFEKNLCEIFSVVDEEGKRDRIYAIENIKKGDNLYHLNFICINDLGSDAMHSAALSASAAPVTKELIHNRYLHCHNKHCDVLSPKTRKQVLDFCPACAIAGLKNAPYKKSTVYPENVKPDSEKKGVVENESAFVITETEPKMSINDTDRYASKIAMDAKTSPVVSVRGYKYAFILICLKTRVTHCILTKLRAEITTEYKQWARNLFNRYGYFPAILSLDKAGEHKATELVDFAKECGTKLWYSETDQSNENSYAERKIGILWTQMLILLVHSGVPFVFWCYAFAWVVFVSNHLPHRGLRFRRPIDVAGLLAGDAFIRVFGCYSVYFLPIGKDCELVGHPAIFLGLSDISKGYFFLDLQTHKVVTSRTGIFWESQRPFLIANRGVLLPLKVITYPRPVDWKEGGGKEVSGEEGKVTVRLSSLSSPPQPSLVPSALPFTDAFPDNPIPQVKLPPVVPLVIPPSKTAFIPQSPVKPDPNPSNVDPPQPKPNLTQNTPFAPQPPIGKSPSSPQLPPNYPEEKFSTIQGSGKRNRLTGLNFPISTGGAEREHEEKEHLWEVEKIVKRRKTKFGPVKQRHGYDYRVKWVGHPATWEHQSSLVDCNEKLKEFCERENLEFIPLGTSKSLENEFDEISELNPITGEGVSRMNQISGKLNLIDESRTTSLLNNPVEKILKGGNPEIPLVGSETNTVPSETILIPEGEDSRKPEDGTDLGGNANPEGQSVGPLPETACPSRVSYDGEQKIRKTAYIPPPPKTDYYEYVTEEVPSPDEVLSYALSAFQEFLGEDGSYELPPGNRNVAMNGPRREEYINAEERELWGLHEHGTYVIVNSIPKDRRKITCTWVYDIKRDENNKIILFKARLVAHGFKQVEGVDYVKTFSSTAQMRSFRLILMLACAFDLDLTQYDISNAFLNGELEEEIYMTFPPGYPGEHPEQALLLKKGLYGLKQASRIWNKRLVDELKKAGLEVCKTEPGILHLPGRKVFVCLHVDDIIVASEDKEITKLIVDILKREFLVKELGELSVYVGVHVLRNRAVGTLSLDQGAYIERVLRRFGKWDKWKKVKVPAPSERLSKLDTASSNEQWDEVKSFPYPSVVGSLMYAAVATRPDIMQAVNQLARFMAKWGKTHVKAADQALNFLRETWGDGITFTKPENFDGVLDIHVFSDSDWAGCPDTRRSTIGYVIIICGGPVSWKSQQKKTLAMSSCEGEYMALSEVGKEVVWICNFLTELGIPFRRPKIFCDSSSAINWAEDPIQHQRTKHVELQYYYIRELVATQAVDLYKVASADNISDPFTKPLPRLVYCAHRPYLMGWKQVDREIICGKKQ